MLSTEEMNNDCLKPLPEEEVLYLEALVKLDEEYPCYFANDGVEQLMYSDHRICRLVGGGYLFLAHWQKPLPVIRHCGKVYQRRISRLYGYVYDMVTARELRSIPMSMELRYGV